MIRGKGMNREKKVDHTTCLIELMPVLFSNLVVHHVSNRDHFPI